LSSPGLGPNGLRDRRESRAALRPGSPDATMGPSPPGTPEGGCHSLREHSMFSWAERQLDRLAADRRALLVTVAAAWLLFVGARLTPCIDMNPDTARYLALAESLRAGQGYTIDGVFQRAYPPLFAWMLVPFGPLKATGFRAEKALVGASALASVLAAYWLLSQRHDARTLALLVVLLCVSQALIQYSVVLRSDVPFMLFALVFLGASESYWATPAPNWPRAFLAAAALAGAGLTRSVGVALYVGAFAWLLSPRRWRSHPRRCALFVLALVLIAVPPAVAWKAWVGVHAQEGTASYGDFIRFVASRAHGGSMVGSAPRLARLAVRSVGAQLAAAGLAVCKFGHEDAGLAWALLFVPVILVGLCRRLARAGPTDYAFCAYGLVVVLWPWPQGPRLWVPVLPVMLGYLAEGVNGFGRLADSVPLFPRRGCLSRVDEWLGRHRGALTRWGVTGLLALGAYSGFEGVAEDWVDCGGAVGYVVLGDEEAEVATFVNGRVGSRTVLAYYRALEVRPAVQSPDARIVALPASALVGEADFLRDLYENEVTHLAVGAGARSRRLRDQLQERAAQIAQSAPGAFTMVRGTRYVRIFAVSGADSRPLPRSADGPEG
jgi:hypothetical protein